MQETYLSRPIIQKISKLYKKYPSSLGLCLLPDFSVSPWDWEIELKTVGLMTKSSDLRGHTAHNSRRKEVSLYLLTCWWITFLIVCTVPSLEKKRKEFILNWYWTKLTSYTVKTHVSEPSELRTCWQKFAILIPQHIRTLFCQIIYKKGALTCGLMSWHAIRTQDHVMGNSGQGIFWQGADKNSPTWKTTGRGALAHGAMPRGYPMPVMCSPDCRDQCRLI